MKMPTQILLLAVKYKIIELSNYIISHLFLNLIIHYVNIHWGYLGEQAVRLSFSLPCFGSKNKAGDTSQSCLATKLKNMFMRGLAKIKNCHWIPITMAVVGILSIAVGAGLLATGIGFTAGIVLVTQGGGLLIDSIIIACMQKYARKQDLSSFTQQPA